MSTGKSTHLDKKQQKETEGGRSALNHKRLELCGARGPGEVIDQGLGNLIPVPLRDTGLLMRITLI